MKQIICFLVVLLIQGCCLRPCYEVYRFDNGDDYPQEGIVRIIDKRTKKIGYASVDGHVLIKPHYAFGFPFKSGRARVTMTGYEDEVKNSQGEYRYWKSDNWFFIDKHGNMVEPE